MYKKKSTKIIMIGAFPPPVSGMLAVNAAVRDSLTKIGVAPIVINTSANELSRSFAIIIGRLPKVLYGLVRLLLTRPHRGDTLYMSVSGGFGQIYEIIFLLVARMLGLRIFLHHHSFAYLDRHSWTMKMLCVLSGHSCTHIVLSPGMGSRLKSQYAHTCIVYPLSNTVFIRRVNAQLQVPRNSLLKLGFLSNLSEEKGVFDFLTLLDLLHREGVQISGVLAGPFQNAETEQRVKERISLSSNAQYVGAKYGAEKDAFLDSIDVFVFPTKYKNEAEPLVLYEAMSAGIPVIAYGRGCIPEIINYENGMVIDPAKPFGPPAISQIKRWKDTPIVYQEASKSARLRFLCIYQENEQRWEDLLKMILGSKSTNLNSDHACIQKRRP